MGMCGQGLRFKAQMEHIPLFRIKDAIAAPGSKSKVDILLDQMEVVFKYRYMFFIKEKKMQVVHH